MSYSKVLICGACDQPASAHTSDDGVVLRQSDGFNVECFRSWDGIGLSSWTDSYVQSGRPVTIFHNDPEYIEALSTVDHGTDKSTVKWVPATNREVEVGDYWLIDGHVTFPIDVSGTEAQSGSELMQHRIATDYNLFGHGADEAPYVSQDSPASEVSKLARWRDTSYREQPPNKTGQPGLKSWVVTALAHEAHISAEFLITQHPDGSRSKVPYDATQEQSNEQRNVYVENNPGFLSLRLLDEEITEKYHRKLLNVYFDKQNNLRVGSVRLIGNISHPTTKVAGWVKASCVRNDCKGFLWVNVHQATRSEMEEFVWAVVSHGNNHAAKWFTERDEFYTLEPVLSTNPDDLLVTDNEQYAFLKEHSAHCRDSKCQHQARMEELRPDLHPASKVAVAV